MSMDIRQLKELIQNVELQRYIAERKIALDRLKYFIDHNHTAQEMDDLWNALPPSFQAFYSRPIILPDKGGYWTGVKGYSTWIPDDHVVPYNENNCNTEGHSWRYFKDKYGFEGIRFVERYPDFTPVAFEKVTLEHSLSFSRHESVGEESSVQERAFSELMKQKGQYRDEVDVSYKQRLNLVWHECEDCRTILLVPRVIHANIKHSGGISIASAMPNLQQ